MKKILGILVLTCLTLFTVNAQQNYYKYRLGLGVGFNSYYGDLSYKFFKQSNIELAYSAHLEFNLNKTLAFRFSGVGGSFSANDRKYEKNPNFNRALNFKTHMIGGDALIILYTDNGKIFKEKAFMSPYFFAGFGAMKFDVFADLYDEDGQQYFYWNDGSIRNIDQNAINVAQAEVLKKNGVYETGLRNLHTEGNGGYPKYAFYVPFGMGLKFRLGDRINLNLESKFNYALTDYLDDVTGSPVNPSLTDPVAQYAANPNNNILGDRGNTKNKLNDVVIYNSVSMYFNFGKRKHTFIAPFLYAPNSTVNYSRTENNTIKDVKIETQKLPNEIQEIDTTLKINNYNFNRELQKERDSLNRLMAISIYEVERLEIKEGSLINSNKIDSAKITDKVTEYQISAEIDSTKTINKIDSKPIAVNSVGKKFTSVIILDSMNNIIDTAQIELIETDSLGIKSYKTPTVDSIENQVDVKPIMKVETIKVDSIHTIDSAFIAQPKEMDSTKIEIKKTKIEVNDGITQSTDLDSVSQQPIPKVETKIIYDTALIEKPIEVKKDTIKTFVESKPAVVTDTVKTVIKKEVVMDTTYRDSTKAVIVPVVPKNNTIEVEKANVELPKVNTPNYLELDTISGYKGNDDDKIIIDLPNPEQEVPVHLIENINEINKVKFEMDSLQLQLNEIKNNQTQTFPQSSNEEEIADLNLKIADLNKKYDDLVIKNDQTKALNPSTNVQDAYIQSKIDEALFKYNVEIQDIKAENESLSRKVNEQRIELDQQKKELDNNEVVQEEQKKVWKKLFGNQEEEINNIQKKKNNEINPNSSVSITPKINLNAPGKTQSIKDTIVIKDTLVINKITSDNYLNTDNNGKITTNSTEVDQLSKELNDLKQVNQQRDNEISKLYEVINELKTTKTEAPIQLKVAVAEPLNEGKEPQIDPAILNKKYNVFFGVNKAEVHTEYQTELINFVSVLNQYPSLKIVLSGYADKTGNPVYNQKLSERRVDSVASFLISNMGLSNSRIRKQFFGSNGGGERFNTENLNRRVEINFEK